MEKQEQPTPVIEMNEVTIGASHAPGVAVVEAVTWTVASSECWIIGGLPGSGKSDLLATAAGLLPPLAGTYQLFGKRIHELPEAERVQTRLKAGIVFGQEGRLFQHLTVAENLALPVCYHRNLSPAQAGTKIQGVLEWTGLAGMAHLRPPAINRTLRQRVALARALALEPEVLLLDDPLKGLDPGQARWWFEFVTGTCGRSHAAFADRKMTLVLAVDDFRPWLNHGEQFALIQNRRWLFLGGQEQLLSRNEPLLRELLPEQAF